MRTTIDLPDDLLRRAKATAALQGTTLKVLVASALEKELTQAPRKYGRAEPIPVSFPMSGSRFIPKTNAEINDLLYAEDDQACG